MKIRYIFKSKFSRQIPDGYDLPEVELIVVDLSDKDGRHSLVQSGTVHVDGGSHGKYKANDASVNVVVLQEALEGDRQCSRAVAHG